MTNQANPPQEPIENPDTPLNEAPVEMPSSGGIEIPVNVKPPANDMPPAPPETVGQDATGAGNTLPPDEMYARLERLGGEPAPDITPEEFARLQQSGQIHIDPRGRVRSSQYRQ